MAKNIIRAEEGKSCFICSALCDDCAYDYCGFKKCEVYCNMKHEATLPETKTPPEAGGGEQC